MTAPYRKKLIEVALPLKAINEASAREKSIRHGHPSTLHLWWARRPLAACRAVLFASLVDDPDSDPAYRKPDSTVDEERAGIKRAELFNLIEELVQWENSNNPRVINQARAEIARCVASRKIELGELKKDTIIFGDKKGKPHPKGAVSGDGITAWEILLMQARPEVVNAFLAEHAPPVLDPFCGGGSIPLEAQRLGLRAYASDLNPVAVLITKALIEIPPKFAGRPPVNPEWQAKNDGEKAATVWQGAHGLAEDVRYYGQWMRDEAEKRIGHLYPKVKITKEMTKDRPDLDRYVGRALTPIAWLWARTVKCPNPACTVQMPLVRSFWIDTKPGRKYWIQSSVDAERDQITFEVAVGGDGPPHGTVNRRGAHCIACDTPVDLEYIRSEGQCGRLSAQLMAIAAEADRGRIYLPPHGDHERIVNAQIPPTVPDTDMPEQALGFRVQRYGFSKHRELFTPRQLVALTTLCDLVQEARVKILADIRDAGGSSHGTETVGSTTPDGYADAVVLYLGEALSKTSAFHCTLATWRPKDAKSARAFGRQVISMVWDYVEVNPFGSAGGAWDELFESAGKVIESLPAAVGSCVIQRDAVAPPGGSSLVISTDPPYYDNAAYAELSDFYYIWLRRAIGSFFPSLFSTLLTPKQQELIANPFRFGNDYSQAKQFFESGLATAFVQMLSAHHSEFPLTIYYAFKQAEDDGDDGESDESAPTPTLASTGWETMLEGLIRARFMVIGTWPIRTESVIGLKTVRNALASSIVLVCRSRSADAPLATRKEFMNTLRRELPEALNNLQHGNIAPVDLAQAAIGPGMAVFTRYSKVVETDGSPMTVRTALGIINQVLDEVLAEQEGDFDADTRWALAWFEQFGMAEGPFGVAETLSKAKNTAVGGLVEARVVKARGGKVQLISRADLPDDWDPTTDKRLTVWETAQHLIRTLEKEGEGEAAMLLNKLGGVAETARELAYRLYSICERKKWADEALAYNGLVIAWPELTKLALSERTRQPTTQHELFS